MAEMENALVEDVVVTVANSSPVTLVWKDVTVFVKSTRKVLLDNVSGKVEGGFYSIMGPSGCGKTTLLNTLACRLDRDTVMKGQVKLNGQDYGSTELKLMSGYVMQDDLLNLHLTTLETLQYTALLRLPKTLTNEEREARVQEVIRQMGLENCKDVIVGSALKKGISGGERKRLCVAMELLMHPLLIFLDEPTSGLDSVTALSLCTKLRNLAASQTCTVVTTIHQPQSKIFALFDSLLLLQAGTIVYQGPARLALDFFSESGFPCPEFTNPADHFLDVITPTPHESMASIEEKVATLKAHGVAEDIDLLYGLDRGLNLPRDRIPWGRQFSTLFVRSMKEQWRRRSHIYTQLVQTILIAVCIGTVFLQIGNSESSTTHRQPVLFFCVVNQGVFGALLVINSFPSERLLTLRERAAGTYHVSAYFLAKNLAETIVSIFYPIIFSCIVYWLVGFQAIAAKFFIFMAFMILCSTAAMSLALMISALCRTTDLSVTVLPMALEICRLFGGYFLPPNQLPRYFSWLDALSYVKYTYVGVSLNELEGLDIHCTSSQLVNGVCPITTGQQTINSLGLGYLTQAQCAGILIAYIVICRAIAYLGMRWIKW